MNPAIDETIYFLKIKCLNVDTFVEQMQAGADNIDAIKQTNLEIYEAIKNLQELLKAG